MQVVNLFGDEWDGRRDRPGWQWKHASVSERSGAELFGASLYEIEPGQRSFPYHCQYVEEEMLIVLVGEPTLRTPDGEKRLARGDVVVFRRGPEGAHQVRNDTAEPVRVLMLSTPSQLDIAEYPDSEKIGVFAEGLRLLVRRESGIDYFDARTSHAEPCPGPGPGRVLFVSEACLFVSAGGLWAGAGLGCAHASASTRFPAGRHLPRHFAWSRARQSSTTISTAPS